jgi:putative transposase
VVRVCRVIGIHRSLWYYRSRKDDSEVINRLNELAEQLPTRGFDEYYGITRNEGKGWGRRRVLRVYREMGLKLRRKRKRRLPSRIKEPLQQQQQANKSYSMDFMSNSLVAGRKLRVLNVMDDCTRESLAAWCDFSIPGEKVVEVLKSIVNDRGRPDQIRVDNGPEFRGKVFVQWYEAEKIAIKYIQPGKPMQNGYIERLNRTFREDVLDAYLFETLEEVRILSDEWQDHYNNHHPHRALKGKTPRMARESLPAGSPFTKTIEREHLTNTELTDKQSVFIKEE